MQRTIEREIETPAAPESSEAAGKTADEEAAHPAKPLLTVGQQIEHLKARGIKFDLCPEAEAAEYLRTGNNYLRTASYRKLFPVQVEGARVGEYVNLDFGHLVALSKIDRRLREALLAAAVDVEHFAKLGLLNRAEAEGEDGYAVVQDYLESLNHADRNRVVGGLASRSRHGAGRDTYAGDLIEHYADACPMWVFLEVVEFGRFVDFYRFCAMRWGDATMLQEHYVLKSVKALRNASAHNSCVVNGFSSAAPPAEFPVNSLIMASLNERGLKNGRARRAKMNNLCMAQIAATLYALDAFCPRESTLERHAARFSALRSFVEDRESIFRSNNSIVSFFDFLWKLVDIWLPHGRE